MYTGHGIMLNTSICITIMLKHITDPVGMQSTEEAWGRSVNIIFPYRGHAMDNKMLHISL